MSAPATREEYEGSTFFQAGVDAKKKRVPLHKAIFMLRPGTWQYDAFIDGYDSQQKKAVGD